MMFNALRIIGNIDISKPRFINKKVGNNKRMDYNLDTNDNNHFFWFIWLTTILYTVVYIDFNDNDHHTP